MTSKAYALTHEGIIVERGNKKEMHRLLKIKGGNRNGWKMWFSFEPIGTRLENAPAIP